MTLTPPYVGGVWPLLELTRYERSPDGTFGLLRPASDPRQTTLYTVEDDWRDNRPGLSCIPAGEYRLHRTIFHKHGYETFEVLDVPGRSRILVHPANTEEDVEGCIGVGRRRGRILVPRDEDTGAVNQLKEAVVESRAAFQDFLGWLEGFDEATLVVKWVPGLP